MGNNIFQGQLKGPFEANTDIYELVRQDADINVGAITHLGIQTKKDTFIDINGNATQIGKTGIYEIGNTRIVALKNPTYLDDNTIFDYTITQLGSAGSIDIGTGSGNIKPGGEPGSPMNKPIIEVLDNATDKDIRPVVGTYYYTKDTGELWYYNQDRMWDLLISSSGQMMVWEDMQ